MKRLIKIAGLIIFGLVVVVAVLLAYVLFFLPDVPVRSDITVEVTPQRVARGEYLANHVAVCMDCHSTRDWALFSGPPKGDSHGIGGERFDENMGFPGSFVAPNITPHGLRGWSDGELYRAITSGVSKSGGALFPIMPYPAYGKMATEDIYSIIAYLKTLKPYESTPAPSQAVFPMNVIMNTMPQAAQPTEVPAVTDAKAYGAYLTNASGCIECHTKSEKGQRVGEPFAGGFVFSMPHGKQLISTNITPHLTTGIGAWTKEQFVARFKAFSNGTPPAPVDMAKGDMQTVMPWTMYAGMSEQDLGAIYDHLRTISPVENLVERWVSAGAE